MVTGLADWALLQIQLPQHSLCNVGVLLKDPEDILHIKLRENWWQDLGAEEGEHWEGLVSDFAVQAKEMGAQQFLNWLEATASHTLRITRPQSILVADVQSELELLYEHLIGDCETGSRSARKRFRLPTWWKQFGRSPLSMVWRQCAAAALVAVVLVPEVAFYADEMFSSFPRDFANRQPTLFEAALNSPLPLSPPLELALNPIALSGSARRAKRKRIPHRLSLPIAWAVARPISDSILPYPPVLDLELPQTDPEVIALAELTPAPDFPEHRNKLGRFLIALARPFRALVR